MTFATLLAGQVEHRLLQHVLADGAQAAGAGLASKRHAGDLVQGRVLKLKLNVLELEHLAVLRTTAFFGSVRIDTRSSSSSACVWVTTGVRPTNSGIMPKALRSCGST